MVALSRVLFATRLPKGGTVFLDSLRILVTGGRGGEGIEHIGGVGGNGGDVYLKAESDVSLEKLKSKNQNCTFKAGQGEPSRKLLILGMKGADLVVPVPLGIYVNSDRGEPLGELNKKNELFMVGKGGRGGCRATRFHGEKPLSHVIRLNLKLIADIGLVGFPNAGKSTLLSALSNAKPEIANYPFTTLRPNVGITHFDDLRRVSIADLPGIIDGAHLNRGRGHEFLKHIERTKLILLMIDINGFQLKPSTPYLDPFETFAILTKELELYSEDLLKKPCLVCFNKVENNDSKAKFRKYSEMLMHPKCMNNIKESYRPSKQLNVHDVLSISAITSSSVIKLKNDIRDILDYHDDIKRQQEALERKDSDLNVKTNILV